MVVSFEDIISKSALNIMKLTYRDLKSGSVLRDFFISKPGLTLTINVIFLIMEREKNSKREKKRKFIQFCNLKLQLSYSRLEIFLTFS